MPSEVDVCNDALGQTGNSPITALDDGSVNANYCTTFYANLRDSLLMDTNWTFNRKRVQLAQLPTAPVFEFSYAYQLPPDYLKLLIYLGDAFNPSDPTTLQLFGNDVDPSFQRFKIAGRTLESNDAIVYIQYSQQITDPNLWGPMFYQVLATMLASKLASAINKDMKLAQGLMNVAMSMLMPTAMAVDGQNDSVDPYSVPDLKYGRS